MAPNHSAEALQSYVLCSLPAQSLSPDQRARCAVLRQGMVREPLAMRKAPTEAETARDLRLAHDLAVQKTPPALPCVAGGINVMCVMGGLLHGFGGMGSYADVHPTKKRGESLMPPLH